MAAVQEIATAEQLLHAPELGRCELVRGELILMSPAGYEHGVIAGRIHTLLSAFVMQARLGVVTAAETGFKIGRDPDTVRAPDVGFVCAQRAPRGRHRGFFDGPPDLAVEVLSPDDRPGDVTAKVHDWLLAGCRAVWVVDPNSATVSVYRGPHGATLLKAGDALSDDGLLPGFRLPVAEVF
jgi:Uma2 family endonuclease